MLLITNEPIAILTQQFASGICDNMSYDLNTKFPHDVALTFDIKLLFYIFGWKHN